MTIEHLGASSRSVENSRKSSFGSSRFLIMYLWTNSLLALLHFPRKLYITSFYDHYNVKYYGSCFINNMNTSNCKYSLQVLCSAYDWILI